MATPSKQQRFNEESAAGYIHEVTNMRTSKKGNPYFNAKLQEAEVVTEIVGYKEKQRVELLQLQKNKTPVKLSSIERTPSYKSPGKFDIKLDSQSTRFSPVKLNFSFETIEQVAESSPVKKIKDLEDTPEGSRVTITAKVLQKLESCKQDLQGKEMIRTGIIIADETGSIELTLWGPRDQVKEGATYTFYNVTMKIFFKKKLTTNPQSTIKKAEDLKNVQPTAVFKEVERSVKVCGIKIQSIYKCCFCSSSVKFNHGMITLKCHNCEKRQLTDNLLSSIRAELMAKQTGGNESVKSYTIPHNVLKEFCGDISNDDAEMLILESNKLRISLSNETSQIISTLKKVGGNP